MNDQKAKTDAGKAKLSLVPRRIIFDIARIREYGNNKYPEGGIDNWKQIEPERYRDAAFRHFLAYLDDPHGVDAESGLPHLWHLACNVAFLCEMEDHKMETEKTIRYPSRGLRAKIHPIDDSPFGQLPKIKEGDKENDAEWLSWNHLGPVLAIKNDDGAFELTEEGKKVFKEYEGDGPDGRPLSLTEHRKLIDMSEQTANFYKDLHVDHMEAEPGWTKWEKAWRETDAEAEYYRKNVRTNKVQFGDYDFESGEIIPRKE